MKRQQRSATRSGRSMQSQFLPPFFALVIFIMMGAFFNERRLSRAHAIVECLVMHDDVSKNNPRYRRYYESKRATPIYSLARTDRSGSVIQSLLEYHAYAFHHNLTYGGACHLNRTLEGKPVRTRKQTDNEKLIRVLGLEDELKFDCPPGTNTRLRLPVDRENKPIPKSLGITPVDDIRGDDYLFTNDYVKHLRSIFKAKKAKRRRVCEKESRRPNKKSVCSNLFNGTKRSAFTIAVHIRREDILPCKNTDRYLPNSFYRTLIDKYLTRYQKSIEEIGNHRVLIYSGNRSYEPWDDFVARGYELQLGTPKEEAWAGMIASDVLITSRSAFSLIPALLHEGKAVAYTSISKEDKPISIDGWETIPRNSSLVKSAENERSTMIKECRRILERRKQKKLSQRA